MVFTRYEIRWYTQRCLYEGGNYMEYVPFDTLAQARKYAKEHGVESTNATLAGIYKVKLHSDWEEFELIERL